MDAVIDEGARQARLAVAAPSFGVPSETFIRDHVRVVAPGQTVLLCQDGRQAEGLRCPALRDIDTHAASSQPLVRAFAKGMALWGLVAESGLYGADQRRVTSFLKAYGVRAVLAEYGPMGVQLMGACREAGVPLYVHFHGYDATLPQRRWYVARQYRQLFRAAAGIIAPSAFLADKLRALGCPTGKLHVSHNGVDPARFPLTRREPGRCLAVGRLVAKKAPHLTIRAFAQVRARCPHARLDIIGDGELRKPCEELVRELGLTGAVVLHGALPHDEVVAELARASVFIQHSVTAENYDIEGLPVSILEAMAAALPVVSTRHSGIPEAVIADATGILVEEGDVDGTAEAMAGLIENPDRAAAMGQAGYERLLSSFTHQQVRERLLRIMGLEAMSIEARAHPDHSLGLAAMTGRPCPLTDTRTTPVPDCQF